MTDAPKTTSAAVKAGMDRLCHDFTQAVSPLGFCRKNSRSRSWERRGDRAVDVIFFHRSGSAYGAPINHSVDIRVHFYTQALDGAPLSHGQLLSDPLRDSEGRAYHLRFNAVSGSMYDRCLEDLLRLLRDHGLPWFERSTSRAREG